MHDVPFLSDFREYWYALALVCANAPEGHCQSIGKKEHQFRGTSYQPAAYVEFGFADPDGAVFKHMGAHDGLVSGCEPHRRMFSLGRVIIGTCMWFASGVPDRLC